MIGALSHSRFRWLLIFDWTLSGRMVSTCLYGRIWSVRCISVIDSGHSSLVGFKVSDSISLCPFIPCSGSLPVTLTCCISIICTPIYLLDLSLELKETVQLLHLCNQATSKRTFWGYRSNQGSLGLCWEELQKCCVYSRTEVCVCCRKVHLITLVLFLILK